MKSTIPIAERYEALTVKLLGQSEEQKSQGNFAEANALLNKIIVHEPECFEAYEELGDNFISLRELAKARKALEQALKINQASANAHYLMGFLHSVERQWDPSIAELQKADEIFPNHPEILRCLGWSCYNNARKVQGIAILERSINLNPLDQNILCDLGVCYLNSGETTQAQETFEKIIQINPESDQAQEAKMFLEMITKHSSVHSEA